MTEVLRSLVGDIGGTNARFALVNPDSLVLEGIQMMSSIDYSDLEDAVRLYLKNQGLKPLPGPVLLLQARSWMEKSVSPTVTGKLISNSSNKISNWK